jgi:hypothetical protein
MQHCKHCGPIVNQSMMCIYNNNNNNNSNNIFIRTNAEYNEYNQEFIS